VFRIVFENWKSNGEERVVRDVSIEMFWIRRPCVPGIQLMSIGHRLSPDRILYPRRDIIHFGKLMSLYLDVKQAARLTMVEPVCNINDVEIYNKA